MTDDIIRNPNRKFSHITVPYQPEYVKQGISVPEAPKGLHPLIINGNKKRDTNPPISQEVFGLDDLSLDENGDNLPIENGHMIDNNEFVSFVSDSRVQPPEQKISIQTQATTDVEPKINDYILMVFGKLITTGSLLEIETKIKNIIYGEDQEFTNVNLDDIVVLKRVNIKVGVFIND